MLQNQTAKKILASLFSLLLFLSSLNFALAGNPTIEGFNTTAKCGYTGTCDANSQGPPDGVMKDVPETIGKIIGTGLSLIGIIFFVLMIYGGFSWMLARGDNGKTQTAKDLIEAAVIGLIIVLSAYAVTQWLGNALTAKQST